MRKPILSTLILLFLIVIITLSSCTLLIDEYNRLVGYNSICWEDNDHILIYAIIAAYDNYSTIGGGTKDLIWNGGEIWRVNVNTGEKELVMRKKGNDYALSYEDVVITLHDTLRLISEWDATYQMDDNYNNWKTIGGYTYPQISEDGKEIVYLEKSNAVEDVYIRRMHLDTGSETVLWETTDNIKTMDYDFDRNLLLLNNIRLVNFNTGLDTVLLEYGDSLEGYIMTSLGARNSMFNDSLIIFDVQLGSKWSKIYMNIDDFEDISIKKGFMGELSPDGSKGAHGNSHSVDIFSINGTLLRTIEFPEDEI